MDENFAEQEFFFSCPYCWTSISMLVEPLDVRQSYIEDCERCCQPIQITYELLDNEISFQADRAQ